MIDDQTIESNNDNNKNNNNENKSSAQELSKEESELNICTQSLKVCQQELEQIKNAYQRIMADFENVKKRMEKERQQWTRIAQAEVLIGLLPIIDNFERALHEKEREKIAQELQPWFEGFQLTYKEFLKYLNNIGIQPITLETFDPTFHEAILSVESDQPSGHIIETLQKGYIFKDHVLRPAKVSIAK